MGSTPGVIITAIVLTILNEFLRDFEQYRMIVFSLLLILMMILRPQGIMGVKELWETSLWRKLIARFKR